MIFSKFFSNHRNTLPHSTETVNLQYERLEPLRVLNADYDFTFADYTISEGDVTSQINIVEITRNNFDDAESVEVLLSPGLSNPASDGIDFGLGPITVNFDANEVSKFVPIEILGDTTVESDETIQFSFGSFSGDGQAGAQSTATLVLENDDQTNITLIGPASGQIEGNSPGGGLLQFSVTLSHAVQGGFRVDFSTNDSTALIADLDYVDNDGLLIFDGTSNVTQTIDVSIIGDSIVELDETISLSLGAVSTNDVGIDASKISIINPTVDATILTDDAASVAINDLTIMESDSGRSVAKFTISLDQPIDTQVSVNASTFDIGSASDDNDGVIGDFDFISKSETITFEAGETEQFFEVEINGDNVVELDEHFEVRLSKLQAAGRTVFIGDGSGTGTIRNNDAAEFNIGDVTLTESDAGTETATFTVSLTNPTDATISIEAATVDASAVSASGISIGDGDFIAKSKSLVFAAGDTAKSFDVVVNGDEVVELNEQFFVELSNQVISGRDVAVDVGQARGTIENNDSAVVSIDDVTMNEGDRGQTNFVFTVSLDKAVDTTVQFDFSTVDGTATTGDFDYTAISPSTRSFASSEAGATEAIEVSVTGDTHFESGIDEHFSVILSGLKTNSRNVELERGLPTETATGTVINDDTQILIQIDIAGNLVITDEVVNGNNDGITISFDSPANEIIVAVESGHAPLGTGDANSFSEIRIDKDDVLGQIVIDTRLGNDVVTIDLTNGNPLPQGGILYEGGFSGDDGLSIIGNGEVAVYTPDALKQGNGRITVDGVSIDFSGLEPVDITGMASVTLMLAGSDDIIDISEGIDFFAGGTESAIRVSGTSGGVPIEVAALWNNGTIIVDTTAVDGNDMITLSGANNPHTNSNLSIVTGTGKDVVSIDGTVAVGGKLSIQSNSIYVGANVSATDVLLATSSNIDQSAGLIKATNLIVDAGGSVTLARKNVVENLAANVGGDLTFNNTIDLRITELTCGGTTVDGLTVDGKLDLALADKNLTQDGSIFVNGETTIDVGSGNICLVSVEANGDSKNDFAGPVNANGVSISIQDVNHLMLGAVTADLDAAFRSGVGGVGRLDLTGNIITNSVKGQVLLQSDNGVLQQSGKIKTSELVLGSETDTDARRGNFVLAGPNEVEKIATRIDGSLSLTNTIDVEVADLAFVSSSGCVDDVNIIGIDTRGNFDITLADADITQVSGMYVTGTATANVVDGSDVDSIATGNVCFSGGDSNGDGLNDNDFNNVRVVNATNAEFTDVNNMTVLSADVDNQLRFWTGAGFQPDGFTPSLGVLTLSGDVTGFRVLLQSSNGVVQTFGGITTEELMLGGDDLLSEGTGDFVLLGGNQITTLTANLDDNLSLRALSVFEGGIHTFMTDCGTFEFIEGIRVRTLIGVSFALATSIENDIAILEPDDPNIENIPTSPLEIDTNAFDTVAPRNEQVSIEAELVFIAQDGTERIITKLGKDEITPDDVDEWKEKINEGAEFRPGVYRLRWSVGGVPFYVDFEKEVNEDEAFGVIAFDQTVGDFELENVDSNSRWDDIPISQSDISGISADEDLKSFRQYAFPSQDSILGWTDASDESITRPVQTDAVGNQPSTPLNNHQLSLPSNKTDAASKLPTASDCIDFGFAEIDATNAVPNAMDSFDSEEIAFSDTLENAGKVLGAAALAYALSKRRLDKNTAIDLPEHPTEPTVSFLKNARRKRRITKKSS